MSRASVLIRLPLVFLALSTVSAQTPAPPAAQRPATTQRPAAAPRPKPAMMASVDPALLKGLNYRLVGPSRGGRVTTVTGVPFEPKTFYLGAASGGVFKTTDNGATWTPITDGQVPLGSTGVIAVADSNPSILYLGTGSDGVRSNVSTGRGIYKSTDTGKTWTFAGLRDGGQTGGLRIHPSNPDIAFAAMTGDIFKENAERGVFKTIDGGRSWRKVLFLNDRIGAMDVELKPGDPNTIYAWLSKLERKPWTITSGSAEGGFYKSTDGGEHFTKTGTGLPNALIGKANIAVTAANPNRIYMLVEAKPGSGLYRSDDAGATWALMNATAAMTYRPFYYTTIGADPKNADVVYAGAETFYKSVDGGKTMTPFRTPHTDNHDLWINPNDSNTMIQANDGGANISNDGGRTWSTQNNQLTAEIYAVFADSAFPYRLYGAQQDANNTIIVPFNAGPSDLAAIEGGPGCETGPLLPHPADPNVVYGSCKGQYEVLDRRTGTTKSYWIGGQSLYGNSGKELILRFQRVSPMNTSPFDPNVLYYGSQYLHRTRDKGVTWAKISPDLTEFDPRYQDASGSPITRDATGEEFYSTLYAISESPLERGVIWTGANDGPFSVTRDDGKTWARVTPKDLATGGRVAWIDPSPHRRGSAYFAVYRYLLGDYAPYIYKTDDYGATWKRLTTGANGIPADTPTRVVREDPNREGLLYAGTEFGMYISFDDGGHWQPFFQNMPQVPINDIRVKGTDLLVATQGRGFWVFDNLSVLEQLAPAVTSSGVKLFAPRPGYRTRVSPALLGPMFEYYLPAVPAGAVTIDVLDAKAEVVNTFSSDTVVGGGPGGRGGRGGRAGGAAAGAGQGGAPPTATDVPAAAPDPEAGGGGGFGGRGGGAAPTRVTKDAGLNRVTWNLMGKDNVSMPPGAYQVRLTVSGESQTQPFTVLIDPNVAATGVTTADLIEQYQHILNVRALQQQTTQLTTRVRNARNAARTSASPQLGVLDELLSQFITWPEGVRYARPGLSDHVGYLAGLGTRTDQKVGRDAIERLQVLKKEFDRLKSEVDRLLGGGQ